MISELKKKIDAATYVSFDIFDTAILRLVKEPIDVFKVISEKYNRENNQLGYDFVKARIQAEKNARVYLCNDNCEEVTLKDIYSYYNYLTYDKEASDKLYEMEKLIEKNLIVRNQYIYEVYSYCIEKQKEVLFISDMYLDKEDIEHILKREGYEEYKRLYLSSDILKTKYSGNLFKFVLKNLKCSPDELLHIGDHVHSDIKIPSEIGINTFYYSNSEQVRKKVYKKNMFDQLLQSTSTASESFYYGLINRQFYSNPEVKSNDFWFDLGYSTFGIAAYGFTKWIIDKITKEKNSVVCFLARDAYLFKKLVSTILPDADSNMNSKYIYMSRRALRMAHMKESLNEEDLSYLTGNVKSLRVREVFERSSINYDKHRELILKHNFSSVDQIIINDSEIDSLKKLFKCYPIEQEILNRASIERSNLLGYLDQEDVLKSKNIILIDIGWNGNIQKAFSDLLKDIDDEYQIKGYYFSTFNTVRDKLESGYFLEGYLVNNGVPYENNLVVSKNLVLLESIFTAPHPSLKKFKKVEGQYIPSFEEFRISEAELSKIMRIQDGIIEFVKDYNKIVKDSLNSNIDQELIISLLRRLHDYPTKREASLLGSLTHFDFGRTFNLAKPLPIYKYIINPKSSYTHMKSSLWREAYLCKLLGNWIFRKSVKRILIDLKKIFKKLNLL
ncbi:hypothetical protein V5E38_18560 [Rossellomorea sp. GAMAL-10_SWC]